MSAGPPILGMVAGIAPASTIDYYRYYNERYRDGRSDAAHPHVILDSIDLKKFLALVGAADRAPLVDYLVAELERLARAGATIGLFCSNTPHLVFDQIRPRSPIPLISIVEATAAHAKSRGLVRLGLIGTRFTMEGGFYQEIFSRAGLIVVTPEADDRTYIHDRYFGDLANGHYPVSTRVGMQAAIDRMRELHRIDGVILGGTELPILFRDGPPPDVPYLDTTRIHVDAAVRAVRDAEAGARYGHS